MKFRDLEEGQTFQFAFKDYAGKSFIITKVDEKRICYADSSSNADLPACIAKSNIDFLDRDVILDVRKKSNPVTFEVYKFQVSYDPINPNEEFWSFHHRPLVGEYLNRKGYMYLIKEIIHFPDSDKAPVIIISPPVKTGVQ